MESELIAKAYEALYPGKVLGKRASIRYSGRFSGYNANVKYSAKEMVFNLSRRWHEIDDDIKMGLIQVLMQKALGGSGQTFNMSLYNNFVRNAHIAIPKEDGPSSLEESFERVNERYFLGLAEKPNLRWGKDSTRKLGSYNYNSDMITISGIFRQADPDFVDYIMYHELLHKLHKFRTSETGRSMHHTSLFRSHEKEYESADEMEKKLSSYIRSWKRANPEKVLRPFVRKRRWL